MGELTERDPAVSPERSSSAAPPLDYSPAKLEERPTVLVLCFHVLAGLIILVVGLGLAVCLCIFAGEIYVRADRELDARDLIWAVSDLLGLAMLAIFVALCLASAWVCLVRTPRRFWGWRPPEPAGHASRPPHSPANIA